MKTILPVLYFWLSCLASAGAALSGFGFFSYPGSHLHMTLAILGGILWTVGCVLSIRRLKSKQGLITVHVYFLAIFLGLGARFFGMEGSYHHWVVYFLLLAQMHVTVKASLAVSRLDSPVEK